MQTEIISTDNPVSITVANYTDPLILKKTEQMQQFYKNERYKSTGDDEWPPYQPDHFTSVALIHHKEKLTTKKEVIAVATQAYQGNIEVSHNICAQNTRRFINSAGHGSPDEYFMTCHSTKNIAQIFEYTSSQNSQTHNKPSTASSVILIEGAPGIGKTILSKEIAFQWANKNLLGDKLFLFLIFLRDPEFKKITSLKDFVAYALCLSKENSSVQLITEYLEEKAGSCVTIVFDGYDEISDEIRHKSFITKVVNRKVLKLCGLIITSRPTASMDLRKDCDCRIEILGFTEEDRIEYIKQCFRGDDDEFTQVKAYLEKNPFINSLCYIPLNMTILICLFKNFLENKDHVLPNNQTEINEQFICITISRFLKRRHIDLRITSLKMLPRPYKQQLRNLSKLAFDLLGKDRIVFNDDDIISYVNWSDLGLLKIVKFNRQTNASYNFLHFSLQEFLAAYYVTSLFTWSQVKLLRDNFWNSRYLNMWVMYVGITQGVSFAFRHFLTGRAYIFQSLLFEPRNIANEIVSDKVKCLHLFQCFLEAGDDKICQQVGNCLMDENIDLSSTTLLHKDMHTLCFFLMKSTVKQWKVLDLAGCCIGDDGCEKLLDLLLGNGKSKVQITTINLSNNRLTSRCILTILKLVQYFNVKELSVFDNTLDSEMLIKDFFTTYIQQQLLHEVLLSIKISKTQLLIFAVNCKNLLSVSVRNDFLSNSNINLCLWNCNFESDNLSVLLKNVNTRSRIQLSIYNEDSKYYINKIQSDIQNAVKLKASGYSLQVSYILISQMQVLVYNVNTVKDHRVIEVLKSKFKSSILTLSLTCCVLPTDLLCTIGNILSSDFKELKIVDISGCNIGDIQFRKFCKALFSNDSVIKHLRELNLSKNCLTSLSTTYIIHVLQLCTVHKLILSDNEIDIDNFHTLFFINRKDTYCNFASKVPLIVVNNSVNNQTQLLFFAVDCKDLLNLWIQNDFQRSNDITLCLWNSNFESDDFSVFLNNVNTHSRIQLSIYNEDLNNNINKIQSNIQNTVKLKAIGYSLQVSYILISEIQVLAYNVNTVKDHRVIEVLKSKLKSSILTLSLTCCVLPTDILCTIGNILSNNFKELKIVDISDCNIGDNQFEKFYKALFSKDSVIKHLTELNLSKNCLTSLSTSYIIHLLQLCTIHKLILSDNEIDINNFHTVFSKNSQNTFCNFASKVPLIVVNNIVNNQMQLLFFAVGCKKLLNSLVQNDFHTSNDINLCLWNSNFESDDLSLLLKNVNTRFRMQLDIYIEDSDDNINKIQSEIQDAFELKASGISLQLSYILISQMQMLVYNINPVKYHCIRVLKSKFKSIAILTLLLKSCVFPSDLLFFPSGNILSIDFKELKIVDISGCNIGDIQFGKFCKALFSNDSVIKYLRELNLSKNCLTSLSTTYIIHLLQLCTVHKLILFDNEIDNFHTLFFKNRQDIYCNFGSKVPLIVVNNSVNNEVAKNQGTHSLEDLHYCTIYCLSSPLSEDLTNILSMIDKDGYTNVWIFLINTNIPMDCFNNIIQVPLTNNLVKIVIIEEYLKNDVADNMITVLEKLKYREARERAIDYNLLHCNNVLMDNNAQTTTLYINVVESFINHHSLSSFFLQKNSLSHKYWKLIDLSYCNIGDHGCMMLLDYFAQSVNTSTIDFLNLSHNNLSSYCTDNIAKLIVYSKIKKLFVSDNEVEEKEIAVAVLKLQPESYESSVPVIQIFKNFCVVLIMQKMFIFSMKELISCESCSVTCLSLINCYLNDKEHAYTNKIEISLSQKILQELKCNAEGLDKDRKITHFFVKNCTITQKAIELLASDILIHSKLTHLKISHCKLQETGLFNILTALEKTASLLAIDFSSVFMSDSVTSIICNIICKNLQLEELNLSECSLHSNGWTSILTALSRLSSLKSINLSNLNIHHSMNHNVEHWQIITHDQKMLLTSIISKNQRLEYINIANYKVIPQIMNSMSQLRSIKHLDISANKITQNVVGHVINAVGSNTNIEYLNMSSCCINKPEILSALKGHKSLTHLNISHNPIGQCTVPMSTYFTNFNLKHLNISFCKLKKENFKHIAAYLEQLPNLKHLNISHNKMNRFSAKLIASAIVKNKSLEHLDCSECGFVDFRILHISLKQHSMLKSLIIRSNDFILNMWIATAKGLCLEYLDFSNCKLSELQETTETECNTKFSIMDFAYVISCNINLMKLNLSSCELSGSQIATVVKALTSMSRLKHLDVSHNKVSNEAANELASVLIANPLLEHLNLSNCELSELQTTRIVKALSEIKSFLRFLDISHNTLTNNASDEIAFVVIYNPLLEHLNLSKCELSEIQITTIVIALSKVKSFLRFLDISHNTLTNITSDEIASVIICNPLLEHLNLSNCELSELQITCIVKALSEIKSFLRFLDISQNTLTNNASDKIASVIIYNPLLEHLNLSKCELSVIQITGIVIALSKIKSFLRFLDISHNTLTNIALDEITSVVIYNTLLEHLNLSYCELSEIQLISIFKALSTAVVIRFLDISCNTVASITSDEIASVVVNNSFMEHSLLTFLNVSHNEVTREAANVLASIIVNSISIHHLDLSACNLLEDSMILIANSISYATTSLRTLDVSNNFITERAAHRMAVALRMNTVLVKLNFSACFVGDTALTIFNAIDQHSAITHLNMSLNVITNHLVKLMARVLINNTNIVHLDLGQCRLQEAGFLELLNCLANVTTLKYLNLEGIKISECLASKIKLLIYNNRALMHINLSNCNISMVKAHDLVEAMGELHLVEYLDLSSNTVNFSVEACVQLSYVFSKNKRIRYLNCSKCDIPEKGTWLILNSLKVCSNLKNLNLQSCPFNFTMLQTKMPYIFKSHGFFKSPLLLHDVFTNTKSLQCLNLADCSLQENDLVAIAKALQKSSIIKYLNLTSNLITDLASQVIASAITRNSKLQFLALSNCRLQETGLVNIAEALCKILSLKHLDLSHNNITDKAATVIALAIANNTTMQCLDFSFCTWQETGITTIHQKINKLPMIKEVDF